MAEISPDLLADVAEYYTALLAQHGDTPRGVDWNGPESQGLRFTQLARLISQPGKFSLHDLGCGYGALYDFLITCYADFDYMGFDISSDMIKRARARLTGRQNVGFSNETRPSTVADYCVASGIFNVRLNHDDAIWRRHVEATIDLMHRTSRRGFAFNCLTSYSDAEKMKDYLYYGDPGTWFDYCKRRCSRDVALLHDYGLYEFTIIVRK